MPESMNGRESIDIEDVAEHWNDNANLWSEPVCQGWDAYREHLNNPAFSRTLSEYVNGLIHVRFVLPGAHELCPGYPSCVAGETTPPSSRAPSSCVRR